MKNIITISLTFLIWGNVICQIDEKKDLIKNAIALELNDDTLESRKIFKKNIPEKYSFLYSSDFLHFRRVIHELFLNNDLYVYQNIDTTDYFWCDRKSASGYMGTPPCNKPFKNYKNFFNSNTIENFTKNSFFIDIFNSNIEISNEGFMIYDKNKFGNTITLSLYKNFGEDFYNADGDLINEIREISWTFQFSYVDNNGEPVVTYFTFSKYTGLKENKSLYNESNFYQGEKYEDLVNWKCILNEKI